MSIIFCIILLNNVEKISFFKHSKISQENFEYTAIKIMNHHIKLVQEPVYSSTWQQSKGWVLSQGACRWGIRQFTGYVGQWKFYDNH